MGETWIYTYTVTVTQPQITAGLDLVNIATADSDKTDPLTATETVKINRLASIGNFVWEDLNRNGVQDSGEAGVAGVTVNLKDGQGVSVGTDITDANGLYLFENLVPGDYHVEVVKPAGYGLSPKDQGSDDAVDSDADPATGVMATTTLEAGENDLTWDAGIYLLASIGNFVWDDLNRNGVQDTGELGVAGVTVKLYDGQGVLVGTDTTDANGLYLFENLVPGDYHVEVVKPAGYGISPKDQGSDNAVDSDADPATGVMATTTLEAGENDLTWDAGIYRLASIGNFVWDDLNRNGVQDTGEFGIPGVTVKLYDGQGVLVGTDTTDANGLYLFENLVPGDYHVEVVKPAGYAISPKDQGSDNAVDSDADPATGVMETTTLEAGENDLTWDAGIYLLASIGNFVWEDMNRNGVQETGEPGVAGVTVNLKDGTGATVGTDTTDANGLYLFENLVPGDYSVEVIKPAGYEFTLQDQGSDDYVDSDVNGSGAMIVTTLAPGENDLTWDAGIYRPASLGNYVWEDLNLNGIQDTGEAGVAGVTVNLKDGTGAILDTTTTDSNGLYLFDNLVPGEYSVEVLKPANYEFTLQDQGSDNAVDSDVNSSGAMIVTTLVSGENDLTWDAGLMRPDLVITKGNSINGPVYLGQSFTWTIEVRNNGSSATFAAGYNFIMRDVLPTGATYSNVSGPNPAIPGLICEIAGTTAKILRCRAGTGGVSLEAGAGFTVSVDVTPTQAGTLDNTAVVDFQNSAIESNEENNSDSDSVEVLLPASLGDYVWEDLKSEWHPGNRRAGGCGSDGQPERRHRHNCRYDHDG